MRKTPKPAADVTRALYLLVDAPNGHTEAVMKVHGFSANLIAQLIKAGLVTARREYVDRGKRIEVVRLRITDAGRARWRAG